MVYDYPSTYVNMKIIEITVFSLSIYIYIKCSSLVDDVVHHDEPLADENVFYDTGDEWEWQGQAFQDSESEIDENEN